MSLIMLLVGAWAAGSLAVRRMPFEGVERFALGLLCGLCAAAPVLLAVASASILAAQAGLIIAAIWFIARRARESRTGDRGPESTPAPDSVLSSTEFACAAAAALALAFGFISAIAPNTSWDATSAHLALAQDYNREGRILVFEGNSYSGYPHLLHTLYTVVFWSGGERAVGLLNWTFALLAVFACFGLGKRLGNRASGLLGAALFTTTPLFFDQAGTSGIDLPFAALVLAMMTALYAWNAGRSASTLVLAAFLAGSSCGVRHTGYLVCALAAAGVVAAAKGDRFRMPALFAAVALAAAAPWLVRSAITTGNPAYPMFASVFGSDFMADDQSTPIGGHESVQQTRMIGALTFPVDVVMRPWRYDGWRKSPGPMVLVLGLPALFFAKRRGIPLGAFAIAGAAPFYFFQRFARYVFPFYAPLYAIGGLTPQHAGKYARIVWAVAFTGMAAGLALGCAASYFKVPAAFGLQPRDTYLAARVDRYEAFRYLSARTAGPGVVLTLDPRTFFIDRPTFANIYALAEIANAPEDAQIAWLDHRGIRCVLYPLAYVAESPVFAAHGLDALAERWRAGAAGFTIDAVIETPRRDGAGIEQTLILSRAAGG